MKNRTQKLKFPQRIKTISILKITYKLVILCIATCLVVLFSKNRLLGQNSSIDFENQVFIQESNENLELSSAKKLIIGPICCLSPIGRGIFNYFTFDNETSTFSVARLDDVEARISSKRLSLYSITGNHEAAFIQSNGNTSSLFLYETANNGASAKAQLYSNFYYSGDTKGGALVLKNNNNETGARLIGDAHRFTSASYNYGQLFLSGSSMGLGLGDGVKQPLIKMENRGRNDTWELGIFEDRGIDNHSGTEIYFNYNGSTVATIDEVGTFSTISDENLKTKINPLEGVLDKVQQLEPSIYEMKSAEGEKHYGMIAQNVKSVFPELVKALNTEGESEKMLVNYSGMIPILIKAIQDQQETIENLVKENKINTTKLNELIMAIKN